MRKSCAISPSIYLFYGDKKKRETFEVGISSLKKEKGGGGLVITLQKRVLARGGGNNVQGGGEILNRR